MNNIIKINNKSSLSTVCMWRCGITRHGYVCMRGGGGGGGGYVISIWGTLQNGQVRDMLSAITTICLCKLYVYISSIVYMVTFTYDAFIYYCTDSFSHTKCSSTGCHSLLRGILQIYQ